MIIADINKPQGWTERNMANGWMKRVPTSADKKTEKLKKENEDLKSRMETLEAMVQEMATKKGKR